MKVVEVRAPDGVVSVQWIAREVGIVRYHGSGGFGSPFSFCLTMVRRGSDAMFYAATHEYSRAIHRAMRATMCILGVEAVHYERRRPAIQSHVLRR